MQSKKYDQIIDQIHAVINNGEGLMLLQKLEFDYQIRNEEELANYLLILLTFMEQTSYFEMSSNLLLRKVLARESNFEFISETERVFQLLEHNAVMPFLGLSQMIRRLISSIIYQREDEKIYFHRWPSKNFLLEININLMKRYASTDKVSLISLILLLYNCTQDIELETSKIQISSSAISYFRNNVISSTNLFREYLTNFLRFKWYGGSRTHYDGKLAVAEPFYLQIFESKVKFITQINEFGDHSGLATDKRLVSEIREFILTERSEEGIPYDTANLTLDLHHNLKVELMRSRHVIQP